MPIAKELALKILGALAVGGTAVGGGIALKNLSSKKTETENKVPEKPGKGDKQGGQQERNDAANVNTENNTPGQDQKGDGAKDDQKAETPPEKDPDTSKILEELGLSCGADNICSLITNKKLSVKQEDNTRTLTSLTSSGEEDEYDDEEKREGKIRFLGTGNGDEKKITFSIEDGNIRPTWEGNGSKITTLEEFETYEVEEETVAEGKKYHFKRKAKRLDEMARLLGLSGNDCKLPVGGDNSKSTTCTLDLAKLKAINFEGKKDSEDPTIGDTGTTTLIITKLKDNDDKDYSKYPFKYQFILSGDKEVKIPATPNEIVKKANDSLGFKIKVTPASGGPKTLTLEKIPQLERVSGSLGFTECKEEGGVKTCKLPKTINVYKDDKNSIKAGGITNWSNQTITYQEDVSGYEGGIKFIVSSDISVTPGTIEGTFSKIDQGDYEAKEQTVKNSKAWYLTKRSK